MRNRLLTPSSKPLADECGHRIKPGHHRPGFFVGGGFSNSTQKHITLEKVMTVHTAKFVKASEVFANHRPVWDAFSESDPDFSWGNNNRTLASRDGLISALEGLDDDVPGVKVMIDLLSTLDDETYIDLEN